MPCYDPRTDDCYQQDRTIRTLEDQLKELKERLNITTRVACELAKLVPGSSMVTIETHSWVTDHKAWDAKRGKS